MIPNITRGDDMRGLVAYLAGPGRRNEHRDQHVVAGSEDIEFRFDDIDLDRAQTRMLGRMLESDERSADIEVSGGHVWHCSLSIGQVDGVLGDDQWRRIARRFIKTMGFDDAGGAKAPCRWAAIRHGLSGEHGEGNDHIHITVNLVRADGTKAWVYRDFMRAQEACRSLEREFGLERLGCDGTRSATRGWKPGERESEARRRAEAQFAKDNPDLMWSRLPVEERKRLTARQLDGSQPRHRLALKVRAAAARAGSEAQFVRNLRAQHVIVWPRYAQGRSDVVTGYSIAERPRFGEAPIWYGGGSLARDLTLPRLRQLWPDIPQAASEAVEEWRAFSRNQNAAHPGTSRPVPSPGAVEARMAGLNRKLHALPVEDREAWSSIAREAAGMMAAWSRAVESVPGPIACAARELSRSAQTYARPQRYVPEARGSMMDAALLITAAVRDDDGRMLQSVLMRQMWRTVLEIQRAMQARDDVYLARVTRESHERELAEIAKTLPEIPEQIDRALRRQAMQAQIAEQPAARRRSSMLGDIKPERFGTPQPAAVRQTRTMPGLDMGG